MQSVQVGESFVHMITCICMFLLAQGRRECGLWAACKSLRLGGGETRRLIPQLFTQPFFLSGQHDCSQRNVYCMHTRRQMHIQSLAMVNQNFS